MYLVFENSYGERILIGEPKDPTEYWKIISEFCAIRNFNIPYVRTWTTPKGEKYYDVSSHTEFFVEVEA
jgi:hypothetical protein